MDDDLDRADAAVLDRLAAMLEGDAPPSHSVELAKRSFGLRTVDAELAELVADSDLSGAAVRTGSPATAPRLLTFEAPSLTIEMEIAPADGRRRALGQVFPAGPAAIDVQGPGGPPQRVQADERGRFRLDDLPSGPVRLVCRRPGARAVSTDWTLVD